VTTALFPIVKKNLNDKYTGDFRNYTAKKVCKWIYDCPYYFTTTFVGILLFRKYHFMPPAFFGEG